MNIQFSSTCKHLYCQSLVTSQHGVSNKVKLSLENFSFSSWAI